MGETVTIDKKGSASIRSRLACVEEVTRRSPKVSVLEDKVVIEMDREQLTVWRLCQK